MRRLPILSALALVVACGSGDGNGEGVATTGPGAGGSGAAGSGGGLATGGSSGKGGKLGKGGTSATGGSPAAGGATSKGGASAMGGSTAQGGATGGSLATGGASGKGGTGIGGVGAAGPGGSSAGGKGGTQATGGTASAAQGGAAGTGAAGASGAPGGEWLSVMGNQILAPGGKPFHGRGANLHDMRSCNACTYLPPEDIDRKPTSVGIAIPNTELWIVDENGKVAGPNEVGQLVIRGATVMRGYWEKPEATAQKLRPGPLPGEMVLYTGDLCRLDEEGYLYFIGRMDDIIKSRGEKVAPKEVENVLMNIRGVREAAVIGVPDEILGQAVKAFVVLDDGVTMDEKQIQRECQAHLENFMVPKYVVVVSELPKTSTGKIKKSGLS